MNCILFDDPEIVQNLLPLTFTRPVAALRPGILTIAEQWERNTGYRISYSTGSHLQARFPLQKADDNLLINGALFYDPELMNAINDLKQGEVLAQNGTWLALRLPAASIGNPEALKQLQKKSYEQEVTLIRYPWALYQNAAKAVQQDFQTLTKGRKSQEINDPHTIVYKPDNVFVEEGAEIKAAIINAEKGPVYIGPNARVHENAVINGNFALGEGAQVNMGAKMRGDSAIGPYSKVGGEIKNSVIQGYSNKAHEGYLGNAVIGAWCNLGANTNGSNMKNNYSNVKVWNYREGQQVDSGQQFCGLIMGDHAKSGISTMFNTGTVVGVAANVFGSGFPPKFLPSFTWGGVQQHDTYALEKALEAEARMMQMAGASFDENERSILEAVFGITAKYREKRNKSAPTTRRKTKDA